MKKLQVIGNSAKFVKAVIEKDYVTARKEAKTAQKTDLMFKRELEVYSSGLEQFEKNILWNYFDGNIEQCLKEIPKKELKNGNRISEN